MKISLVIPAYNEAKKIGNTVLEAKKYFENTTYEYEIIVSDDGSSDETLLAAQRAGATAQTIGKHAGKGSAVRHGVEMAKGDVVVFTDADLPYRLDLIDECVRRLELGAELVIGDRYYGGYEAYGIMRRIFSRAFSFVSNMLLRLNVNDTQCGFKAFEAKCAKELFSSSVIDGFGFDTEILYIARKRNKKLDTVKACMVAPPVGSSVKPVRDGLNMLMNIFEILRNDRRGIYGDRR